MNDQTKKLTNLGIVFAIAGFTMVGGALVLIPKLVDEKVKSIRAIDTGAELAHVSDSTKAPSVHPEQSSATPDEPVDMPLEPPDAASNMDNGSASDAMAESETEPADANRRPAPVAEKAAAPPVESGAVQISDSSWELVLVEKYEPDEASRQMLNTIIDKMKSTPGMRLQITGINNINKMSKLAQIGANRVAGIIVKEADISPERLDISVEQETDIKNIRVRVTLLGGAQ